MKLHFFGALIAAFLSNIAFSTSSHSDFCSTELLQRAQGLGRAYEAPKGPAALTLAELGLKGVELPYSSLYFKIQSHPLTGGPVLSSDLATEFAVSQLNYTLNAETGELYDPSRIKGGKNHPLKSVLVLGDRHGEMMRTLSGLGLDVYAQDPTLNLSQMKASTAKVYEGKVWGDSLLNLELPSGKFDLVLGHGVLSQLENKDEQVKALRSSFETVAPRGMVRHAFVLTANNVMQLRKRLQKEKFQDVIKAYVGGLVQEALKESDHYFDHSIFVNEHHFSVLDANETFEARAAELGMNLQLAKGYLKHFQDSYSKEEFKGSRLVVLLTVVKAPETAGFFGLRLW